jgi:hypothetical protein
MNSTAETTTEVLCCPTALVPIGLSLGALVIALVHFGFFGADLGPDEGAAAHVWQLLMAAQIPALALFTAKWSRRARRPYFNVLKLQGLAILICIGSGALAPLYFLRM